MCSVRIKWTVLEFYNRLPNTSCENAFCIKAACKKNIIIPKTHQRVARHTKRQPRHPEQFLRIQWIRGITNYNRQKLEGCDLLTGPPFKRAQLHEFWPRWQRLVPLSCRLPPYFPFLRGKVFGLPACRPSFGPSCESEDGREHWWAGVKCDAQVGLMGCWHRKGTKARWSAEWGQRIR